MDHCIEIDSNRRMQKQFIKRTLLTFKDPQYETDVSLLLVFYLVFFLPGGMRRSCRLPNFYDLYAEIMIIDLPLCHKLYNLAVESNGVIFCVLIFLKKVVIQSFYRESFLQDYIITHYVK